MVGRYLPGQCRHGAQSSLEGSPWNNVEMLDGNCLFNFSLQEVGMFMLLFCIYEIRHLNRLNGLNRLFQRRNPVFIVKDWTWPIEECLLFGSWQEPEPNSWFLDPPGSKVEAQASGSKDSHSPDLMGYLPTFQNDVWLFIFSERYKALTITRPESNGIWSESSPEAKLWSSTLFKGLKS